MLTYFLVPVVKALNIITLGTGQNKNEQHKPSLEKHKKEGLKQPVR